MDDLSLPAIRLLVADEDQITREATKKTLKQMGVEADTCESGAETVKLITDNIDTQDAYEVVLLAWNMSDMSGLEVTRKLRQLAGDELKILVISSYDWISIEKEAKKAGVDGFIQKPLFQSNLYEGISDALSFSYDPRLD
jgi:CheY-like chemotaxis protein